ncbi:MAG TPA: type I restriction enzyme HsdR N-terminal domain-containing protein [Bacteroidales bacterium]|nr:type I restriction enzyme HsdR N-terminal domain-containing protein [Bacteroidales bacterium]HRZ20657.1 type I restriction enzyme HsdR N-terminal domain-containing protein [Bacteroidales bacterium]
MADLPLLNFPPYAFQIREKDGQWIIFDRIRRRFVRLTPEEWVRQHMVQYLIEEKKVPATLIAVEKSLRVFQMKKRVDIAVHTSTGTPVLLVECKSPAVMLSQETFDQLARYNLGFPVRFWVVTNGMVHYCCRMDDASRSLHFLNEIPDYLQMQ